MKVPKRNGDGEEERPIEALMILKYGGVLTHAGRKQVLSLNFLFTKKFHICKFRNVEDLLGLNGFFSVPYTWLVLCAVGDFLNLTAMK